MKKIGRIIFVYFFAIFLMSFNQTYKYNQQLFSCIDKVIRLVEWENVENTNDFEIGFMGDHHLFQTTHNYFRGKTYKGKPLKIVHIHDLNDLDKHDPMALYIGKNKSHLFESITKICSERHIFTISDDRESHKKDIPLVMLHVHESMVDMIVNRTEAEKQRFKISYHLLRAAKEIH